MFLVDDVACVVGSLAVLEFDHAGLALIEVLLGLLCLGIEVEVDGDDLAVGVIQLGLPEHQDRQTGWGECLPHFLHLAVISLKS